MRTVGSNQATTLNAIRAASLDLIFQHGFNATSLRTLARKVGLQVGSLYNYFDTKEDLLVFIIENTLKGRLQEIEERVAPIEDPVTALCTFIELMFGYHTLRKEEMVISNRELRSLSGKNYKRVVRLRDQLDARLTKIIEKGRKQGVFSVADTRIATFAIISMISGVSSWYQPDGRLSDDELRTMYVKFGLGIVGKCD